MGVINSIIKVLRLVDQQGVNVFRMAKKGYSLSSYQILEGVGAHCNKINTIIDVGANQGQFALASHAKFPDAKIISFEPLPDLFLTLQSNLRGVPNLTMHNMALGNEKGAIDFYRNEHSHASSALVISEKQTTELPNTARTHKTSVTVDRLDDVLRVEEFQHPILLKLDVQGYEKRVLMGATKSLTHIDFIVFEASFVAMYENEPLFDEMHAFLKESGFEIVAPVGQLEGKNRNVILQMDFLYKNRRTG